MRQSPQRSPCAHLRRSTFRLPILLGVAILTLFAEPRGQSPLPNALPYSRGFLVTGNYVVGGVDLPKEGGVGTINVGASYNNAVPAGADVVAAYLYWETVTTSSDALNRATFRGHPIGSGKVTTVKSLPGTGASCWGSSGNDESKLIMYRADVLSQLPKQLDADGAWTGKYIVNNEDLQAQQLGLHTVTLPQQGTGNVLTQSAGATLLLVYRHPSESLRRIVLYDGAYTASTPMELRIGGIYGSVPDPQARMTHIVGSGASNPNERILVNGSVVAVNPFAGPTVGSDRAWATVTLTANNGFRGTDAGDGFGEIVTTRVEHTTTSGSDECLAWAAIIYSTAVADVDADGLPDAIENALLGLKDPITPAFPDGQPLPNLNAMGASPGQKDLFVEINAMWATAGTKYGSSTAPYNATTAQVTDAAGHSHLPTPDVLKMVGDTYARNGITAHFDVGDVAAYFAGQEQTCAIGDAVCDARPYLVPSSHARGGEQIKERACDPASGVNCQFPDYPGTVGWKLGVQVHQDAPVGDDGEELTKPQVQKWGTPGQEIAVLTHRRRFDRERSDFFHYLLYAHARGKAKAALPCLDPQGNPITYDITRPAVACKRTNPLFHVPSSTSGIADLPGNTAMVTLGLWDNFRGSSFMQASTTLHELGHNLDLWHGGAAAIWGSKTASTVIEPNCKPNYLSSMSYLFQAHGLVDQNGDLHIDYSGAAYPTISEAAAIDGPLMPAQSYVPYWFAPAGSAWATLIGGSPASRFCSGARFDAAAVPPASVRVHAGGPSGAIDWDGNPSTTASVGQDVNFDGASAGTLTGHDDWANLRLDQIGAGRRLRIHSNASGDFLDFGSGDFLDFGSGDFLDFGSGDFLDFGSGTYYVNFASGDFLDFGSGDFLDFGSGDFLDFGSGLLVPDAAGVRGASGDFLDFGSGDFLDFGSGDFLDFGSGDFLDFGSGDFLDFGSGDFLDFGAGDFLDFGAGLGGQELDYDLARALGRTPPRKLEACVLGATCTGSQPAPGTTNYHRTSLRWQAPTFGSVFAYHVYRVTGPTVTPASTRVLVGSTSSMSLVDAEELPNGVAFSYFVTAEFSDETPRKASGASNFVSISAVNDPPVAVADSYTTSQGTPLTVTSPGLLGNDTDTDSPAASLRVALPIASTPANGTLNAGADGSFTYTPNAGFYGIDSFTYRANNGSWSRNPGLPLSADSNTGTVTITVTQVVDPPPSPDNRAPVCQLMEPSVVTGGEVTLNHTCSDADGDPLTVTAVGAAARGTTTLLADGRFKYVVVSLPVGSIDTFTYTVSDGKASATGTVRVRSIYRFVNVENVPPVNGRAFSRGGIVPMKWRWTNAAGVPLDTTAALPNVMAYACSATGNLPPGYPMGPFTLAQPGSGNSFVIATKKNSFTWQFNWKLVYTIVDASGMAKTYELPAGTYVVAVGSGLTGQKDPTTTHNCGGQPIRGALITVQ